MLFFPIQATQATIMIRLDENKLLQNTFKRIALHLLIQIV